MASNNERDNGGAKQNLSARPSIAPTRDEQGRWLKGVSGNRVGPRITGPSPATRIFRIIGRAIANPESSKLLTEAVERKMAEDPIGMAFALIDRVPKEIRTAIYAQWLMPHEQAGLVRKFEIAGSDEHAVELVYAALTRVAAEDAGEQLASAQ